MNHRYCDFCGKEISGDYHKVCFVEHIDKKQLLNHSADMCINCFEKLRVKQ